MKYLPILIILLLAAIMVTQVSAQTPPLSGDVHIGYTEDGQEGYYGPSGGQGPFPYQGGVGYGAIFVDGGEEMGIGNGYGPGSSANFLEKQRRGVSDPFPVGIGPAYEQVWSTYMSSLQRGSTSSNPSGPVSNTDTSTSAGPSTIQQVIPTPVAQAPVRPVIPGSAPVAQAPIRPPESMTPTPVAPSHLPPAPLESAPVVPAPVTQNHLFRTPVSQTHVAPAPTVPYPMVPAPVAPTHVTPTHVARARFAPVPVGPARVVSAPMTQFHMFRAPATQVPVASAPMMIPVFVSQPMTQTSTAGNRAVSPTYRIIYAYPGHRPIWVPMMAG